jgi:tellurite resistance protein TerC
VIFAVDSIPAIFAVTKDPFIVYTSNVFAILGLRSLYFALAGVMDKFHYLKIGLGVVLTFVGVKMFLGHTPYKIDTHLSLGVIVAVLASAVVASLVWPKAPAQATLEADPAPPDA